MTLRCAIIYPRTFGLQQDCEVLEEALQQAFPGVAAVSRFDLEHPDATRSSVTDLPDALAAYDFLFCLERLYPIRELYEQSFARRVVFVPNIEWITRAEHVLLDSPGRVHAVFHKNRFSARVFGSTFPSLSLRRSVVVGWTSRPIASSVGSLDFGRALHIRGRSLQKQTEVVLDAWSRNPSFPPLTVVSEHPLPSLSNVIVHTGRFSEAFVRQLQTTHGLHICPSLAEGFGHSLNEARAAGAVLITTDAPPMHDLVRERETGFLIPVRPQYVYRLRSSWAFPVTTEDLAACMTRVLRHSPRQLMAIGLRAREAFSEERLVFVEALRHAVCAVA